MGLGRTDIEDSLLGYIHKGSLCLDKQIYKCQL